MEKDCGRSNEQLDTKALAVYHVAEGEGGGSENSSRLFGFVTLSKCCKSKKTDL